MRVAILGTGGVGGYFGGRLAAGGADVMFVARGPHLAALRERGLRVISPHGDIALRVNATDDTRDIGPVDIVFFTVKLYDSSASIDAIAPLVGPDTLVVPFQNGVESVSMLSRAIGAEHVAGGTTYIVSAIAEPGTIRHTALGRLLFGPTSPDQRVRLERLLQACRAGNIDATLSDQIEVEIWAKFVRLTALSGMTAVTRRPVGALLAHPDLWAMTIGAVHESVAVARAKRVALPEGIEDEIPKALAAMPPESKSSMLGDLEGGRRLELPWLSGAVVRLGREIGVATPIHHFITTVLAPHSNGRAVAGR